jgi:hypothetical protein
MKLITTAVVLSTISLLAACGGGGDRTVPQAEPAGSTSAVIGDHEVHFNAQSTDQLSPQVARAYKIVRSKNRAILTISVLKLESKESVLAEVSVKTVNLTGQLKNVIMRKINEGESIYYIGETPVANRETLIFELSVTPEGVEEPSPLRFKRQFYSD